MAKSIKLAAVRLSKAVGAKVVDLKSGVNGKANEVVVDGQPRQYVVLDYIDDSNPVKYRRATRTYWYDSKNERWTGGDPSTFKKGMAIPGCFVLTKHEPVTLNGNTFDESNILVLEGERMDAAMRAAGKIAVASVKPEEVTMED